MVNDIELYRNVNFKLKSNTYLISSRSFFGVYVIDPGDIAPIIEWLNFHKSVVLGVFITHTHYDHIYGLNDLLNYFPDIPLYMNSNMKEGLFCTKLNSSKYHGEPYTLDEKYIKNFHYLFSMNSNLLWRKFDVVTLCTPGHTKDSLTIKIFNFIFSGDALIPGVLFPYRNKLENIDLIKSSVLDIYNLFKGGHLLCPGHGVDYVIEESIQVDCFRPVNLCEGFSRVH